jgi:thiamine biosynthesis lipoprotein
MELDRLEQELSRFQPNSEISRINRLKQGESLVVSPDTFNCLRECMYLYNLTRGAFDVSAGPLIDLWKKPSEETSAWREPSPELVEKVQKGIGLTWLHLEEDTFTVHLPGDGIHIDLGGYGKGYALQVMGETLSEWGIEQALLHSGYSTVLAYSTDTDRHWPLSFRKPGTKDEVFLIDICNQSISSSGIQKGTHIVDPRNGQPVQGRVASWVVAERPDHADALSTAFLLMEEKEIRAVCSENNDISALIMETDPAEETDLHISQFGRKMFFSKSV